MGTDNNDNNKLNNENHSITHIVLTLLLIINLVTLWFSLNTYFGLNDYIDIQSGRVNRTEVIVIEDE